MEQNIVIFLSSVTFLYLAGVILAIIILNHKDFDTSAKILKQVHGKNMRIDAHIYSWYFIWSARLWIWKEIKFKFDKFNKSA